MSVISDMKRPQQFTPVAQYDVVVVGAGPYGLTAAAQLRGKGLNVAIFGKPLELWREHMPAGMFLRSHWWATNLADPKGRFTFERFLRIRNYPKVYPIPIEHFIEYGLWFQRNAVPNVDETYVSSIERKDGTFVLTLEDGRVVRAPAVVMALGVYYYANRPVEYSGFPAELVSHSFEHADFERFTGKKLLVIGAGQSAIENAALANETGATVYVVARDPIKWLGADQEEDTRPLLAKIKAPRAGIAPGWKNCILQYAPYVFYRFPQEKKDRYLRNHYNAAASDWLRNRIIGKVHLYEGQDVTLLRIQDNGLAVTLSNGQTLYVDHVMLGTGYEVDVQKLPMLHPSLAAQVRSDRNIPLLSCWYESSVPGLYFIGLSSVRVFGPLFRFVVGARAAGERVASSVARYVRKR